MEGERGRHGGGRERRVKEKTRKEAEKGKREAR